MSFWMEFSELVTTFSRMMIRVLDLIWNLQEQGRKRDMTWPHVGEGRPPALPIVLPQRPRFGVVPAGAGTHILTEHLVSHKPPRVQVNSRWKLTPTPKDRLVGMSEASCMGAKGGFVEHLLDLLNACDTNMDPDKPLTSMFVVLGAQTEVGTRPSSQRFTPGTETVVFLTTRQLRNDIFGLRTDGWGPCFCALLFGNAPSTGPETHWDTETGINVDADITPTSMFVVLGN